MQVVNKKSERIRNMCAQEIQLELAKRLSLDPNKGKCEVTIIRLVFSTVQLRVVSGYRPNMEYSRLTAGLVFFHVVTLSPPCPYPVGDQ